MVAAVEVPLAEAAVTLKVYVVPSVSPDTVQLVAVPEQVAVPGEAVTV